jgi:hypothetical protein
MTTNPWKDLKQPINELIDDVVDHVEDKVASMGGNAETIAGALVVVFNDGEQTRLILRNWGNDTKHCELVEQELLSMANEMRADAE